MMKLMIAIMNNGNHLVVASLKHLFNASTNTGVVTCLHLELTSAPWVSESGEFLKSQAVIQRATL